MFAKTMFKIGRFVKTSKRVNSINQCNNIKKAEAAK